jgi:hypothetical protein
VSCQVINVSCVILVPVEVSIAEPSGAAKQILRRSPHCRNVGSMGLARTTLRPMHRFLAAWALVAFCVAQTLCFAHCNLGESKRDSIRPSCHGASSQSCHNETGCRTSANSPSTPVCSILKNPLASGGGSPTLVVPEFSPIYLLPSDPVSLEAAESQLNLLFTRQANQSDRVFTPEVSLGPAFRSLAPPLLG